VLRRCVCACAVYKFINSIKKENAMISKSSSGCVDHKMAAGGGAVGEGCCGSAHNIQNGLSADAEEVDSVSTG
jgi:hypothetical protein